MHADLAHAFAVLEEALRPGPDKGHDVRCPDTWEAITTLETLGSDLPCSADTVWKHMADLSGPQPRHQARRVLEVLRGFAETRSRPR